MFAVMYLATAVDECWYALLARYVKSKWNNKIIYVCVLAISRLLDDQI